MLCYLARIDPNYLKCIKDGKFQPKTADGDAKPKSQWTPEEKKVVIQDQRLKSINMSCLPNDMMNQLLDVFQPKKHGLTCLPEKWLTFSHGLRNANHTQTLDLVDIYGRFVYKDNLIQRRSCEEYLRDLDIEYHERALLVFDDEEVTQVKVLMALADDELTIGKSHARNDEWVDITIRKVNTLLLMDEDADWKNFLKILYYMISKREDHRTSDHEMYIASLKRMIAPNKPDIPHTEDTKGPPDLINTKGTHEQNVQNGQMITQPTDVPSGNNIEVSGSITESLILDVTQSHILNQASISYHPIPQDRWNKNDENGITTKNKARLVVQDYSQEEGIDYDETFTPVARMEAIRIFLAFATYMNFKVYQIDVKSTFLNDKLKDEVFVKQAPSFESICWSAKKQQSVTMSSAEAEYVAAVGCCASILWMKSQLNDYETHYKMNFLREFWSTAVAYDHFPSTDETKQRPLMEFLIKFLVLNRQRPLILDFNTFLSTGLGYNNGKYVAHPTHEVISGNYSSTKHVNSIQQLFAYCLITGTQVDIKEIIYIDLLTRLLNKSRMKYVSYPRFISRALQVLLGSDYTHDKKFRDSLPPLPLYVKPKKSKSQTMTPTIPKSQDKESDEEEVLAAEYYDENVAHRDQTDKLVESTMSTIDKSSMAIKDLYQGLNIITQLLKDINNAVKDDPAINKKIDEAIKSFTKISTDTTEASAAWAKSFINIAWNIDQAQPITLITIHPESSQAALRNDKGKGIATDSNEDPSKKLVPASTIVRPDPDEEKKFLTR
uniref:Retrovirus-related Pol polyprotein from transposon TNT 1-94 n=1 Tax=Tanacetum cinerariifolium TaxID=118510 RepID=A0A6L2MBP4_TANCI|nr:retrovirus-related Pol polyprotein from transposon TNT 1-94 [Tanacetum cinerariifolium]